MIPAMPSSPSPQGQNNNAPANQPVNGYYYPPNFYAQPVYQAPPSANAPATAALWLGSIGLIFAVSSSIFIRISGSHLSPSNASLLILTIWFSILFFVSGILGLLAIIFGHIGVGKFYNGLGRWKAIVGLVTGYLAVILWVFPNILQPPTGLESVLG